MNEYNLRIPTRYLGDKFKFSSSPLKDFSMSQQIGIPGYTLVEARRVYEEGGKFFPLVIDGGQIFIPVFPRENIYNLLQEISTHIYEGNVYALIPELGNSLLLGNVSARPEPYTASRIHIATNAPSNVNKSVLIQGTSPFSARNYVSIFNNAVQFYIR